MTKSDSGRSRSNVATPKCPYCDVPAVLEDGSKIKKRGLFWFCVNFPTCNSFVPCHKGTEQAVGTLANKALRYRRRSVMDRIDMCWRSSNGLIQREAMHDLVSALMRRRNFRPGFASMRDIDAFELAWPQAERVAKEWIIQGDVAEPRAGTRGVGSSVVALDGTSNSASVMA